MHSRQLIPVPKTGETMDELHLRSRRLAADLGADVRENHKNVQTIVIFYHAALVISLGQAVGVPLCFFVRA